MLDSGSFGGGAAVAHAICEAFEIGGAREGTIVGPVETRHQLLRGIERFADGAEWNSGEHERLQGSRKHSPAVLSSSPARRLSITQLLRQSDAQVFKKYSQMKLRMKREALEKLSRRANEMAPVGEADAFSAAPLCTEVLQ